MIKLGLHMARISHSDSSPLSPFKMATLTTMNGVFFGSLFGLGYHALFKVGPVKSSAFFATALVVPDLFSLLLRLNFAPGYAAKIDNSVRAITATTLLLAGRQLRIVGTLGTFLWSALAIFYFVRTIQIFRFKEFEQRLNAEFTNS